MDAAQPARALGDEPSARYLVPAERHQAETVIERSRFVCTLSRVQSATDAQRFIRDAQQQSPQATHHCWAYVLGAPGTTSRIGMSDDGEPHGTAGRPMLTVLLHSDIGEIAAVVTRWYGGTKLGTGGLARAYSGAVQSALSALPTSWRVESVPLQVAVDYNVVTPVQQLFAAMDVEIRSEAYAEQAVYDVLVARDQESKLRMQLADLTRGQALVTP